MESLFENFTLLIFNHELKTKIFSRIIIVYIHSHTNTRAHTHTHIRTHAHTHIPSRSQVPPRPPERSAEYPRIARRRNLDQLHGESESGSKPTSTPATRARRAVRPRSRLGARLQRLPTRVRLSHSLRLRVRGRVARKSRLFDFGHGQRRRRQRCR